MSWGQPSVCTHVSEIQGSVDFVHDIERRRLVVVQGEDQGETAERLFATG